MAERFAGKVVVITGASSGFGKGAACRFAEEGAYLVLVARRAELLAELAEHCIVLGGRAIPQPADVSKRADVERIAQAALREYGRIDIWINNAGVGALGRFERIPLEDHEQVVGTNFLGPLYGSYFAYRQFLAQGAGILINVASGLGGDTVPYYSSYAAAKHAVVGLGEALRHEIAQGEARDIHVCTLMPAAHDTPFFDHAANYTGHEVQPPRPLHDPDGVVETIVRLALHPEDGHAAGQYAHPEQMEDAPPAADSPNALHAPMRAGTEVSAGRRG